MSSKYTKVGIKRNRLPLEDSPIFAMRGTDVKWPTLRGVYLTDTTVAEIRKLAYGVIFFDGEYNTRLNFRNKDARERAVFFEHLQVVDGDHLFLLSWIGNYHAGAIFHCAWQFPQHINWPRRALEFAAFRTYRAIANIMYRNHPDRPWDPEVLAFLAQDTSKPARNPIDAADAVRSEFEEPQGCPTPGACSCLPRFPRLPFEEIS